MIGILRLIGQFFGRYFTSFSSWLVLAIPYLVWKVLQLLGIGVVTYYGFQAGIDLLETWIFSNFSNISTDMYSIMVIAGIPDGFAMVFAASGAVFIYGAVQKVIFRKSATASVV
jgi:hypothetical protein